MIATNKMGVWRFLLCSLVLFIFTEARNTIEDQHQQKQAPFVSHRVPRSTTNFVGRVTYFMGPFYASKLSNYGRWCGWGGAGSPVDAIDSTCKAHDECRDRLQLKEKCSASVDYSETKGICTDVKGSCPYKQCECDMNFIRKLQALESQNVQPQSRYVRCRDSAYGGMFEKGPTCPRPESG